MSEYLWKNEKESSVTLISQAPSLIIDTKVISCYFSLHARNRDQITFKKRDFMEWISAEIESLALLIDRVRHDEEFMGTLERICALTVECLEKGGKILTLGNGGSATDAMHLAEELIGRFRTNRRPLPALCLSVDASTLSCIANDFGYEEIFSRQIEALCAPGDLVVAFSTSGNSPNIVRAFKAARDRGAVTIGLLGKDGGAARALCDAALIVPHAATARIQELHTFALHAICEALERKFGTVS